MHDKFAAVARELIDSVEPGFDFLTLRGLCGPGVCRLSLTSGPSAEEMTLPHHPSVADVISVELPGTAFELQVQADGTFEARVPEDVILEAVGSVPPIYTVVREPRYRSVEHKASSLAEVEAVIGAALPAEVHELFASGAEMVGDVRLLRIDDILYYWNAWAHQFGYYPREWELPVQYLGPPGAVRLVSFNLKWVPIGFTDCADLVCVDLAPGPAGRVGQLIQVAGEVPLTYLADSVTGYAPPAEEPDYGHLGQELEINGQDLDLARLASVRDLAIVDGGVLRLGELAHLPLERLQVTGDEIELPACETLTSLVVRSSGRVELPSLPSLRVLDVSGADVDVESLPEVEYLVLNPEQWQRCSQQPAAASLAGEVSVAGVLDWARERGPAQPDQVFRGRA
ncbi:SMI1/KNR4 family protein [Lentzea terrae]|uniref:SMI1/KNR4 family protein n=1 Tax=Lentzea terrae TaxID=2200761 RepID=UPI000DD2E58B|nr:SMI1/KNR4 family protein [Lentzea terrae]